MMWAEAIKRAMCVVGALTVLSVVVRLRMVPFLYAAAALGGVGLAWLGVRAVQRAARRRKVAALRG